MDKPIKDKCYELADRASAFALKCKHPEDAMGAFVICVAHDDPELCEANLKLAEEIMMERDYGKMRLQ